MEGREGNVRKMADLTIKEIIDEKIDTIVEEVYRSYLQSLESPTPELMASIIDRNWEQIIKGPAKELIEEVEEYKIVGYWFLETLVDQIQGNLTMFDRDLEEKKYNFKLGDFYIYTYKVI